MAIVWAVAAEVIQPYYDCDCTVVNRHASMIDDDADLRVFECRHHHHRYDDDPYFAIVLIAKTNSNILFFLSFIKGN